jgi:hypothetical protein
MAPKAAASATEPQTETRAAKRARNRAEWRKRGAGAAAPDAPEYRAQQQESLDTLLQSLGGAEKGLSIAVLQVLPQRHGDGGIPAHILEQPYSPGLREVDLKQLVEKSGCAEPGTFELRVIQNTEKGTKLVATFRKGWRWKPEVTPATATSSGLDQMRQATGVMKDVAEVTRVMGGTGVAPLDVPALLRAVGDNNKPATDPTMGRLVEVLVSRFAASPPDPVQSLDHAVSLIDRVRGPAAAPTNPMEILKNLGDMMGTIKALAGTGAPAAPSPSPWVEVLRLVAGAVAPIAAQIPAMWAQASAQRQAALEFQKRQSLATYVRAGVPLETACALLGIPVPPAPAAESRALTTGTEREPRTNAAERGYGEGPSAGPLAPFYRAIVEGDGSVFPAIAETIQGLPNGQALLDQLASGAVNLPMLRDYVVQGNGRATFAELWAPGADEFFGAFITWLQTPGAASA